MANRNALNYEIEQDYKTLEVQYISQSMLTSEERKNQYPCMLNWVHSKIVHTAGSLCRKMTANIVI